MFNGETYQITLVHLDGRADFRLAGEFDLAAVPELREHILRRLAESIPVFVDLRDVTFMDSSCLGVFLHAAEVAKENVTTFRLVNVTGMVRRVLEITGTIGVLIDQESVHES